MLRSKTVGTVEIGLNIFCVMIRPRACGAEQGKRGGLNGPRGLLCLNIWSPLNKIVWEELGGLALLEEVCHFPWPFGFSFPVFSLPSACGLKCELSAVPPASLLHSTIKDSGSLGPLKGFLS